MFIGEIKIFNAERGFGFIRREDRGADVFVHVTALARAGVRDPHIGDRFAFDLVTDDRSGRVCAGDLRAI